MAIAVLAVMFGRLASGCLRVLTPLGKLEVDEVVEHVVDSHPTVNQETIGIAVEAVINLEKTRSGLWDTVVFGKVPLGRWPPPERRHPPPSRARPVIQNWNL
jgi:hypothetical protein